MAFKIIPIFAVILYFVQSPLSAQEYDPVLAVADSLFAQKKYTQSFEIYENLLRLEGKASPAMLLKMAYIREGLGDYSNALYYLNTYYLRTNNKRALRKMEDIAKKYDLKGYQFTDLEFFLNIFYRYYSAIVLSLSSLLVLLLAYMVYKKRRLRETPGFSLFYTVLTMLILFYVVNFGKSYHKGIIIHPDTYLMEGPSAGSRLVTIADQGHRLKVKGKKDVWVKVEWEDKEAYIREKNLMQIMEL
ncbi:MAG: SH3 domain-containing protein [Cyclobacteriaceae bacterium]|nr:SH3 domain-containing protein [Cyclobacteriaceae bacterium]